jgi:hypothetical protein
MASDTNPVSGTNRQQTLIPPAATAAGKGSPRLDLFGESSMSPAPAPAPVSLTVSAFQDLKEREPQRQIHDQDALKLATEERNKDGSEHINSRDKVPDQTRKTGPAVSPTGSSSPSADSNSTPSVHTSSIDKMRYTAQYPEKEISAASFIAKKVGRVLQSVVVRSPHVYISITLTYVYFIYGKNNESFAYEAATFVGVASTVYCFVRAAFLELPDWILPQNKHRFWRHLINASNTLFITLTITSAVWKLNISAIQGTAWWTLTFVAPFYHLSQFYTNIDDPKWGS